MYMTDTEGFLTHGQQMKQAYKAASKELFAEAIEEAMDEAFAEAFAIAFQEEAESDKWYEYEDSSRRSQVNPRHARAGVNRFYEDLPELNEIIKEDRIVQSTITGEAVRFAWDWDDSCWYNTEDPLDTYDSIHNLEYEYGVVEFAQHSPWDNENKAPRLLTHCTTGEVLEAEWLTKAEVWAVRSHIGEPLMNQYYDDLLQLAPTHTCEVDDEWETDENWTDEEDEEIIHIKPREKGYLPAY